MVTRVQRLAARLREKADNPPQGNDLAGWKASARRLLAEAFTDPSYVEAFDGIRYTLGFWTDRTTSAEFDRARQGGVSRACAMLRSAADDLDQEGGSVDGTDYDPDLWAHVAPQVAEEEWGKVASQTAVFLEDQLRTWGSLPEDVYGKELMVAVFKPDGGVLPCGRPGGESQGWLQLAVGFAQAVRNVDLHRIQDREDVRTYAIGVLGTASLLLTQLRFNYGNRLA